MTGNGAGSRTELLSAAAPVHIYALLSLDALLVCAASVYRVTAAGAAAEHQQQLAGSPTEPSEKPQRPVEGKKKASY